MHLTKKTISQAIIVLSVSGLVGCQSTPVKQQAEAKDTLQLLKADASPSFINANGDQNSVRSLVRKCIESLEKNKLDEASAYINLALKLDITNPDIQLFNGLVYHLMGLQGDATKLELAEQGYQQALRFEPGYLAAHNQLGLLYSDQRRYSLAQEHFAAVALHRNKDINVLYNLATSSYYARDPKTAEAALKRVIEIEPEASQSPEIIKAMSLVLASMNDQNGAHHYLADYRQHVDKDVDISKLEYRIDDWKAFYDLDVGFIQPVADTVDPNIAIYGEPILSQDLSPSYDEPTVREGSSSPPETQNLVDGNMVVVDVVLIGTQEDVRHSRGINLLNGLRLQFGDPFTGTPALSYGKRIVKDYVGSSGFNSDENLTTRTKAISIPAVSYSLNIANSLNAGNRVLAKPSLIAQSGETSEFFSGTEILAAAVSGGSGDSVSVQKEVGVKLAVTPELLPDDMLRLHVVAERTFLTDPSNSVVFEFRLDTTKTNINSTVTMKYGETLVLGGLSEREESKATDGVPVLKDIPGLNLLFSEKVERTFERSVLILLTPRRPHFTQRASTDIENNDAQLSSLEKEIARFQHRHGNWYTPRPVFDEIIDELQGPEFFKEFRIGDMKLLSWQDNIKAHDFLISAKQRLLEI